MTIWKASVKIIGEHIMLVLQKHGYLERHSYSTADILPHILTGIKIKNKATYSAKNGIRMHKIPAM
ncbi:MAG: hypothetical protein NTW12_09885 [Deltaproteobacteria bacterium]|nr:hypothetical protein [Deltaproteobacteria bacterium]